jgi:predicted small secreted protein
MRHAIVIAAAAVALLVAGCNTVAGLGRDVQAAGSAVASAADDVRR